MYRGIPWKKVACPFVSAQGKFRTVLKSSHRSNAKLGGKVGSRMAWSMTTRVLSVMILNFLLLLALDETPSCATAASTSPRASYRGYICPSPTLFTRALPCNRNTPPTGIQNIPQTVCQTLWWHYVTNFGWNTSLYVVMSDYQSLRCRHIRLSTVIACHVQLSTVTVCQRFRYSAVTVCHRVRLSTITVCRHVQLSTVTMCHHVRLSIVTVSSYSIIKRYCVPCPIINRYCVSTCPIINRYGVTLLLIINLYCVSTCQIINRDRVS